ncbi:MAG: ABC transporter permease [Lachnospiraceae bacterium]|nr:ABC transporter permease [Lachnospiraceae bacterium]
MMKKIVLGISGGISFLIFLILLFAANYLGSSQLSQSAAERWSSEGDASQVSCFFSVDAGMTEDRIIEFQHTIDGALTDASVLQESTNPGARLWADAYSADGKVTISSDKTSLSADAIGIGGDFFLFHPLKLLYGSYFSGNDLMQDYCVIDEDAAWQLFGSNDVAGMMVSIGGVPHIVTGVVERPSGRLAEAAGLDSTLVYVSYKTLTELGESNGINHYEIVMPNPITGFAANYIREQLGADEKETEVVENTTRYSLVTRLKLLTQFGTRSMNGKAIIYPYWENIARGYEDILMVMTLFELLFLLYPVILGLVFFCIWWRHKGWTGKDVWYKLKDMAERRMEKLRENRKRKKNGEIDDSALLEELEDEKKPFQGIRRLRGKWKRK